MFISITRPGEKVAMYEKVSDEEAAEKVIDELAIKAIENKMQVRKIYNKGKFLGAVIDGSIIYRIET